MPRSTNKSEDLLLSAPHTKSGRLQRECLKLLREHERNGDIPTQYLVPITATNGQSGGFTVTDIVPLLMQNRRVLYIGDYELRGPADQIEQNTRRYIEEHTGRTFGEAEWTKIALTEQQVDANIRLKRLSISKLDNRYKPAKRYEAIECEALGQGVLVRLIRKHLDRLLPEPIADVREREERQRVRVRSSLTRVARSLDE